MIDPPLKIKIVLIIGANHGISSATAKAFAAQGAKVFVTYYREKPPYTPAELQAARAAGIGGDKLYWAQQQSTPNDFIAEIRARDGSAYAHEADLADPANIPLLFDLCEEHLGPVDVLVNNHTYCVLETFDPARVTEEGFPVSLPTAEVIDAHFTINARAYALLMREYVANVSYAASKHAIESYSRSAALELGKYGITVNIVAPGPTQTGYITPAAEAEICANTPLGRLGEPDDIADAIIFLASEQARWLMGQLLYVGGGWRIGQ
jgi:3-oxoacyl-[acyl-carrier protein] reductase